MRMTTAQLALYLQSLIAAGQVWDAAGYFVGLFVDIDDHGEDTVMTDLTLPTGALGTAQAMGAWGDMTRGGDGKYYVSLPTLTFQMDSGDAPTNIIGFYVSDLAVSGNLFAWHIFDEPQTLIDELSVVYLVVRLAADPDASAGEPIVYDGEPGH